MVQSAGFSYKGLSFAVMDNRLKTWWDIWNKKEMDWIIKNIHPCLTRHAKKLLGEGLSGKSVFVPLCGNTIAMKWFADLGNQVVGVDISDKAIVAFFEENSIPYKSYNVPTVENCTIFESINKNIKLYCCDFYKFYYNLEPKIFDVVWDSSSFSAMEPGDRPMYGRVIRSLVGRDTTYFLETTDRPPHQGPVYFVPKQEIEEVFGPGCSVEQYDYFNFEEIGYEVISEGTIGYFIYSLTFKDM